MISVVPMTIERLDDTVTRNVDVIALQEQSALRAATMLVAGCGSVGGSVVEPLVRMGIGSVVLADPETFDLTNINRQACLLKDVGLPKAMVIDERIKQINPYVETRIFSDGITEENIEEAFKDVNIVFDAVDAASSPWIKYRLHAMACARRIPVMAGFDFGGKAVIYVFDYRRRDTTPFYGRATEEAHRQGHLGECLKWLGYTHYPADFLPIIQDRMQSGRPWPQVAYCVQAMGALGSRCTVDLLMNRKVPHTLSLDTHMKARLPLARLREYLRVPHRLAKAYAASRRKAAPTHGMARGDAPLLGMDTTLRKVIEAMITAPSPHNCQPWAFTIVGDREVRIGWSRDRTLPVIDPDSYAIAYSLGCAIEAAAAIADVQFEPSDEAFMSPTYSAGTLSIRGIEPARYARGLGLLDERITNRGMFADIPWSAELADTCDRLARECDARAVLLPMDSGPLHRMAFEGALRLFRDDGYLSELLGYMRLSAREERNDPTGFSLDGLALGKASAWVLGLLRGSRALRATARALGLARHMAATSTLQLRGSSQFLLVTASEWTDWGRVNAGRALMRAWLELTRHHLDCQPVDFPISTPEGREKVLAMFGLDGSERPIALLRVGRAHTRAVRRSLRLPLSRFCTFARDETLEVTKAAGRDVRVATVDSPVRKLVG